MPTPELPLPTTRPAVARAARRWHELCEEGLELSFEIGPEGLEITLCTLAGEPLRRIGATQALRVAEGAAP